MVRGKLIGTVLLLIASAPSAWAQDPLEQVITEPSWAEMPTADAMGEAYPDFASRIDLNGWAQMECRVTLQGRLALCEVIKAVPAGMGFDRAALALTPQFRINPRTVDGDIEKSSVRFSVRFRLGDDEPAPVWTGRDPTTEELSSVRQTLARLTELRGPPPNEMTQFLDVDPDRREAVLAMIRRVDEETLDQRLDGFALVMSRTASPAQMVNLLNGRPPGGAPPPEEVVKAASGDLRPFDERYADRVRGLYCARYACLSATDPDPES